MILRIFYVFVGVLIFSLIKDVAAFNYDTQTSRELCETQCTALCFQNQTECVKCQERYLTSRWIANCETEGCKGGCDFLQRHYSPPDFQDLPTIPDVMTFLAGTNVFVSWSASSSSTSVLYVLQMKRDNNPWTTVMSKVTNTTYEVDIPDICAKYKFRVMAINNVGSNGFSMPAVVPDIMPGPLTNVAYVGNGIYYYPMTGDFAGIVHLDLPQGWDDSSLSFEFDDNPTMQCPSLYNVPKLEFLSLPPKNMTTHIQHAVGVKVHGDGFGCVFHSRVRAVSRCGVKGMWTNVTVNLKDCFGIKSFPCSSIQIPFNPPGNVKNVTLRADLHYVQARLRINWSPPDDLGSTGILDHYLMRWGKVRLPRPEDLLAQPKYIEDSQTKLDRTIIEFEVWVPKENDISYGFQIVPLAPNQPFKSESWGLFQLFTIPIKYDNNHHHHTNGTSTGHPLSDQDVSIVQIPNSLNISVIWSYAEFNKSKRSFNDHYLVQYGEVDSENAQSFRSNNTCTKIISPV